jgi:transmembrane sensor
VDSKVIHLFKKYINNTCTANELDEILILIEEGKYAQEFEFALSEETNQGIIYADLIPNVAENDGLLEKIQNTITAKHKRKNLKLQHYYQKYAIAAMFLIVSCITFYLYTLKTTPPIKNVKVHYKDIPPGSNKAFLTLANGQRITLNDADVGALALEQGAEISKTNNGQLIYQYKESADKTIRTRYNTIEIPKGGQYEIRLPDGTKVWLNAATILKYPTCFTSLKERRVELNGEAYFEVAHNKKQPFKVVTGKQVIEVLGTHFNVNSYTDEPAIETTLLAGSVKISPSGADYNFPTAIITPGQQASFLNHKISIQKIDTEEVMSWKNGDFVFKSKDFKAVMRSIARWYNVDVVYENNFSVDMLPGGWISRKNNISTVLEMIESTGKVHFKIEGRSIMVKK